MSCPVDILAESASGSGKSTLASIVAGIHEPDTGVVARYIAATRIATVTQEVHLFAGTVRDNLTLADPDADDGRINDALLAVHAETILAQLPDGLDTVIGHGGTALTAAQAQHLALARIVLADPDLAILDEATAEAGAADTNAVDRAAVAALSGRAALVIAHRLSQAAECDRIMVIEAGRVIEQGAHADLLRAAGTYAELWRLWNRR